MASGLDHEGGGATDRWTEETVRLYRRYEIEIVEACELCPWASRVRRDGRLRERVLLQLDTETLGPSLDAIQSLSLEEVDVALLIYPRLGQGRAAFEQFAARVRDADVARRSLGTVPFVLAVFHPDADPDIAEPERLIPFLRRTPDPTIQLLRSSVLDRVRGVTPQGTQFVDPQALATLDASVEPSLRERIASVNLATTLRIGVETMRRRFEDLTRDRDATHRMLKQTSNAIVDRAASGL
jgi:hypothetical protein